MKIYGTFIQVNRISIWEGIWVFGLFGKKKIVIDFEERYYNLTDLKKAVVKHFQNKGTTCEVIDTHTLLVDHQKYTLSEKTISMGGVPLQRVILKEA